MVLPPDSKMSHLHFRWDNMMCLSYKQINHLQSYSPRDVQVVYYFHSKTTNSENWEVNQWGKNCQSQF